MRIILLLSAYLSSIVPLEDDEFTGNFRSTKSPLFLKNWFEAATELSVGKRLTNGIPGAKCLQFNNRTHCFLTLYRSVQEAQEFCQKYNLSLVHVNDSEHNQWLAMHARDISLNNWWIGIKDTYEGPRKFKWLGVISLNYKNWAAGMPTTIRTDLSVTFMNGFWYTNDLHTKYYFICEGNLKFCPTSVKTNTICHVYQGRAHFFITSKKKLAEAEKYCYDENDGHLVIIQDENHNNWLISKTSSRYHWLIGLHDIRYREYKWLDNGQNMTYVNLFGYGELYYYKGYLDCIFMSRNTLWHHGKCTDAEYYFICSECEKGKCEIISENYLSYVSFVTPSPSHNLTNENQIT